MNFLLLLLCPLFAWGGTLYYVDDEQSNSVEKQSEDPRPIFSHPRLEPSYIDQEILYFQDQKYTQSVVDKKNSSYLDINYGYSDLTVSTVTPTYFAQNYTTDTTITTTNANGSTTQSNATMTINETFAINSYGTVSTDYIQASKDPSQQYFLQVNAVSRAKNFGVGVEMTYINNPIITLKNPSYTINQTTTSTATTTSNGSTYPTSEVSEKTVPVTLNTMTLKVVNIPIHFSMQYFPIYDGYFQPFLKAAIGMNLTHTDTNITENNDPTRGTLTPLYQTGWAVSPFTYSYGIGCQIMLTPSLALTCSYLKQNINGRSTKFLVIINDQNDSSVNGSYGDLQFDFSQKTTLKEIGLAYYF